MVLNFECQNQNTAVDTVLRLARDVITLFEIKNDEITTFPKRTFNS